MTINEEEFENFVFEQALTNAISFGGKANPKAMIGKCMPKFPEMKQDMPHYMNKIENIVEQVNEMNTEKQKTKLLELNPNFEKEQKSKKEDNQKKEKNPLPKLEGLENGKLRLRYEPAPSGYLHLGHLFPIISNYAFKEKFGGKFILRFGDTNPDNIDVSNYEKIIDDVNWITGGGIDEIFYQSERLKIYYKYLRQLVEIGKAYVCECSAEDFKTLTDSCTTCTHAKMPQEKQIEMFNKFMNGGYKQGEAVVRFRADISHKNPALRTFPLARINKTKHAHIGESANVWPNMHLAVAVDDCDMNMTHVIRGKDHEINTLRQEMIQKALGLKRPKDYFHHGRIKFEDINLSKSDLQEKINQGIYTGWTDPRVPSLISHRKRGYQAKAFRDFILSLGISKRDSRITAEEYYKGLNYFNKQILEKEADRFFFIQAPRSVHIKNINEYPEKDISLPKHPEDASKGFRHFKLDSEYWIEKADFEKIEKGDMVRLMHFGNFKILKKEKESLELEFISKEYDRNLKYKSTIHFLPKKDLKKAEIILHDNSSISGFVEDMHNPKEDSSYQFERFGFVRFDYRKEDQTKVFYFTHR